MVQTTAEIPFYHPNRVQSPMFSISSIAYLPFSRASHKSTLLHSLSILKVCIYLFGIIVSCLHICIRILFLIIRKQSIVCMPYATAHNILFYYVFIFVFTQNALSLTQILFFLSSHSDLILFSFPFFSLSCSWSFIHKNSNARLEGTERKKSISKKILCLCYRYIILPSFALGLGCDVVGNRL